MAPTAAGGKTEETKQAPRTFFDKSGSYQLPNDATEHERLDYQALIIEKVMHGRTFHAPLQKPRRLLDVGCGTGVMTEHLGRGFPDAEVIGVDLSAVPPRADLPPNVTFVQGDIRDMVKGDDRFKPASFDYVFHRFLVMGMTNWPEYITAVSGLVSPGGWLEVQDMDMTMCSKSGQSKVEGWYFWPRFVEDCKALRLDVTIGRKLKTLLESYGGFTDVHETVYRYFSNYDPDYPEESCMMRESRENTVMATAHLLVEKICGPRRTADEMEKLQKDVALRWGPACEQGDHARISVVFAKKP